MSARAIPADGTVSRVSEPSFSRRETERMSFVHRAQRERDLKKIDYGNPKACRDCNAMSNP